MRPARAQDNGFAVNGQVRRIPFEVMVRGDKAPVYEETLEDLGRFNDQPALPFNAYGTMALARGEFEANSGSSQVFWLLKVGSRSVLAICTPHRRSCFTQVSWLLEAGPCALFTTLVQLLYQVFWLLNAGPCSCSLRQCSCFRVGPGPR